MGFLWFGKKKKDDSSLSDGANIALNNEMLTRGGDAARELNVGLTGVDNKNGLHLTKSLMSISNEKLNSDPEIRNVNIKQQAGFSAEVLDTAKRNADAKMTGSDRYYSRIDDVPGHAVNETAYDVAAYDASGNELPGSAAQMKFIKSNPRELMNELTGKNFREKYPHGTYRVAADDYQPLKSLLDEKITKLENQLDVAQSKGDHALSERISQELEYTKKVNNNLQKSEITRDQAIEARLHPVQTTVSETLKIGHEVGKQCAIAGGAIAGGLSLVNNVCKVITGEKDPKQATAAVIKDTAVASAKGYIIGQANTALTAVLKNSSKEVLRSLGKSNAPAYIVSLTMSIFDAVVKCANGKMTTEECMNSIARSGTGLVGSATGAAVGAVAGPVGAFVGSLIGGVVTGGFYDYSMKVLNAPRLAYEERMMIEQECRETERWLEEYRKLFDSTYVAHTNELKSIFGTNLSSMAQALNMNDPDKFIISANTITEALGQKTQYNSVNEFRKFLDSDDQFDL